MSVLPLSAANTRIGCAISDRCIALARLIERAGGPVEVRVVLEPRSGDGASSQEDALLMEDLVRARGRWHVPVSRVVASAPPGQVSYRRVSMMHPPESSAALHEHIAREWGVPAASIRVDRYDIPPPPSTGRAAWEGIAVVIPSAEVQRHADTLRGAGLIPTVMDTTASALARCVAPHGGPMGQACTLVVDEAGLLVIVADREPVFACFVRPEWCDPALSGPAPTAAFVRDVCVGEPIRAASLARGIRSFLHYLGEAGLGHIEPRCGTFVGKCGGGGAELAEVSEDTGIEFVSHQVALCPLLRSWTASAIEGIGSSEALVAIGLALYEREVLADREGVCGD